MKNKILSKIGLLSSVTAMAALVGAFGMSNVALADRHGGRDGDSDNRGHGSHMHMVVQSSVAGSLNNSGSSSNMGMGNSNSMMMRMRDDDEDEDINNVQRNNFEERIQALEALVRQLEARILFLEQRAGVADVTPPVIFSVRVENISANGANVRWTTNEPATSKVFFSATTPVNLATAASVSDAALVMNHSLHLAGLTANTTFHFVIESADGSNNVARSAEMSFVTAVVPDTAPPVISAITSTNVTATAADINWTTNEPATSKVFFSATTPVNLATAASVSDAALVINHSLHLAGLTANTTFHFVIESRDASNNVSTSAEQSFATAL